MTAGVVTSCILTWYDQCLVRATRNKPPDHGAKASSGDSVTQERRLLRFRYRCLNLGVRSMVAPALNTLLPFICIVSSGRNMFNVFLLGGRLINVWISWLLISLAPMHLLYFSWYYILAIRQTSYLVTQHLYCEHASPLYITVYLGYTLLGYIR